MNGKNKMKTTKFQTKKVLVGTYSALLSLAVIAVIIVVNLFVGAIPSTYTKYDTSRLQLYSISEETEALISNIGDEVTIYLVAETGSEDQIITELLGRYEALNGNIKVKYKDPVTNPQFTMQYTTEALTPNSLIVESEKRSTVVLYEEIYVVSYSFDENYNVSTTSSFNGENRITSAIQYVVSDEISKVYTLTGHGEAALSEAMLGYIKDDNIDTAELNFLIDGDIPEDATCIIIYAPTEDLNMDESAKLLSYIQRGGNVIILFAHSETEMPNLQMIYDYYGVEAIDGLVFDNGANNYAGYPYYLLPNVSANGITDITGSEIRTFMPFACGMKLGNIPSGYTAQPLFTTTEDSYLKSYDTMSEVMEKEAGDVEGPFYIGVMISDETTGGGLTVISSPYLLASDADYYSAGNNSMYFMGLLNYLCDNDISVSIASKNMQIEALLVPYAHGVFWSIFIIGIIPIAIIAVGLIVWIRRKKR